MSAYIICYCCLTTPFFIRKSMALLAFVSLKGVRPNRPNHPRLYGRKKLKIQTKGVYKLTRMLQVVLVKDWRWRCYMLYKISISSFCIALTFEATSV